MEEERIIEVLESIGLSKNEALVFLDLIRAGKSSVMGVSKRTGIHRSNIYDILIKLLKKGLVDQMVINERQIFYPIDPKDLLNYHEQEGYRLKEIIPEIEKIQNKPYEENKITVSEGLNSARNILNHLLNCDNMLLVFGTSLEPEIIEGFMKEFHRKRIEKKVFLRYIDNSKDAKRSRELNKLKFTEARYFPSLDLKVSTNICGERIIIILWDYPTRTINIKNKTLAELYRNNFYFFWNISQKPEE